MNLLFRLMSPVGLLLLTAISYFYLALTVDFSTASVADDVLWLGVLSTVLGGVVVSRGVGRISLTTAHANSLFATVLAIYAGLTMLVIVGTGGHLGALLDERFSIPGFGVLFPFFFVGATLAFCAWRRCDRPLLKLAFLPLFFYIGIIAGGKSFFVPAAFGLSLAALGGVHRPKLVFVLAIAGAGVLSIGLLLLSVSNDLDWVWFIISNRIAMSADSVRWFSFFSSHDIAQFPISAGSFTADLLLRFVGLRIDGQSVGSAIAATVSGDDSGGGPNPTLPILAYLVTQGDVWAAGVFVLAAFSLLLWFIGWCRRQQSRFPDFSIYFGALLFFVPFFIIDVVMFLQQTFAVLVIAILPPVFRGVVSHLVHAEQP